MLNCVCAFSWYSKYVIARPIYFSSKSVDLLQKQMAVFRPNILFFKGACHMNCRRSAVIRR